MMRAAVLALAVLAIAGPALAAGPWRAPRHAWGDPDLGGIWSNASYTKLQRPAELKGLTLAPDAARAYEAKLAVTHGIPAIGGDVVGQAESEFLDAGDSLARIGGQARTSWIVDPADGRLPYTPEARRRLAAPESMDDPEARPGFERCVVSPGSLPPMLSSNDANLFQFVQTKDHVAIVAEKYHDVRIIPLNRRGVAAVAPGAAPDAPEPPSWSGRAVGHWEGQTLVVETSGFRQAFIDRWPFLYQSGQARVVERFTRTGPDEMLYAFEVTDPTVFTRPWRAEMLFRASRGPLYEYACHEGNYSLPNILAGARRAEADKARAGRTGG